MIAWPLAAQNGCQSSYTWLFGSTCSLFQSRTDQFCSKWLPFSLNSLFDNWLLKMAANLWLLGHWQLKMATYQLTLGFLDLHAPCSSPDLISSAQNGFHLLWIAHLTINCLKWLPIQDCLAIDNSKWLPIYFYLVTWLQMLLDLICFAQNGCHFIFIFFYYNYFRAKQVWMRSPTSLLADLEFEYLFDIKTLSGRPLNSRLESCI